MTKLNLQHKDRPVVKSSRKSLSSYKKVYFSVITPITFSDFETFILPEIDTERREGEDLNLFLESVYELLNKSLYRSYSQGYNDPQGQRIGVFNPKFNTDQEETYPKPLMKLKTSYISERLCDNKKECLLFYFRYYVTQENDSGVLKPFYKVSKEEYERERETYLADMRKKSDKLFKSLKVLASKHEDAVKSAIVDENRLLLLRSMLDSKNAPDPDFVSHYFESDKAYIDYTTLKGKLQSLGLVQ